MELLKIENLLNEAQSSKKELLDRLSSIHAILIDGYWRVLDSAYQVSILKMILLSIVQGCGLLIAR